MPKIIVTKKVRALLWELDQAIAAYNGLTAQLTPDSRLDHVSLVNVAADRELQRTKILGVANRLNKASTGQPES